MNKEIDLKTPPSAPPPPPNHEGIDWREYFHAVVDRLWIVILCVVVGGIYAGVTLSKVETTYRARAVLFIEQDKSRILDAKMEQVRDEQIRSIDMINTVVDLLRSYSFAQRVSARRPTDVRTRQKRLRLRTSTVHRPKIGPPREIRPRARDSATRRLDDCPESHQVQSGAIRCNQAQSDPIGRHQRHAPSARRA